MRGPARRRPSLLARPWSPPDATSCVRSRASTAPSRHWTHRPPRTATAQDGATLRGRVTFQSTGGSRRRRSPARGRQRADGHHRRRRLVRNPELAPGSYELVVQRERLTVSAIPSSGATTFETFMVFEVSPAVVLLHRALLRATCRLPVKSGFRRAWSRSLHGRKRATLSENTP